MTNNQYPLDNKLKELRLGLGLRQEDVAKLFRCLRNYAKFILIEGTMDEKREFMWC